MCKRFLQACLFTFLFSGVFAQQTTKAFVMKLEYLMYLPKDYNQDTSKRWPVVIFLHGSGERGSDIEKVKVHGIPMKIEKGEQFPFIAISPQCPNEARWEPYVLNKMLDEIIANYRVDEDRVYLTGLSMGGYGTWSWACENPNRFAAIVPICGGGNPNDAWKIRNIPTWVFHGVKDNAVPIQQSKQMVDTLTKMGANPKFTVYPEVGHNSWVNAYNTPELYSWMLAQKRNPTIHINIPAEKMNALQGEYLLNGRDTFMIKIADNKLMGNTHNQRGEIFSDAPNRYYMGSWWNNMIEFTYNKKGKVTGLIANTEDEKINGRKIK